MTEIVKVVIIVVIVIIVVVVVIVVVIVVIVAYCRLNTVKNASNICFKYRSVLQFGAILFHSIMS